jgi:prepilin-type N-terminal cleavage/methylation domain-containing protein
MLFKFSSFFCSRLPTRSTRGFGLIELMVSISIMTLVSTVILVKNRSFNNALLLRNQAYEIAFSLRQAQLLAVSGTKESAGDSNQYGIHFNVTNAPSNYQYRTFRDDGNNTGWYDAADVTIGTLGSIDNRFVIDISDSSGVPISADTLSITFVRPNFDALFRTAAGNSVSGPVYLKVTPKEGSTAFRLVEVTATGQINVR